MKEAKTKKTTHTLKSMPYLLPAIISIIIFSILPILNTIYLAFTDYTMYSQGKINFVGIANFKEVFAGPFKEVFFPVFIWTCVFATLATAGTFLLGLIMAILVNNENIKERGLIKQF